MRKTHPKSRLKTLPWDRQQEIFDYLEGTSTAPPHTLHEAEAWLAAAGIDTQQASLSQFRDWFPVASKMRVASSTTDALKEVLCELPGLDLSEDRVAKAMQFVFEAEAIAKKDTKLGVALLQLRETQRSTNLQEASGKTRARQKDRQLAQRDKEIKLAIEKFQFDGAQAALAHLAELRSIAADRTLNDDQKVERVRLRLWGAPPKEMETRA